MVRLVIAASLLSAVSLASACSECEPSVCTDGVAIQFVGTGPDAGLLKFHVPYTATLEIHDSDGVVTRHEFSRAEDGSIEPDDVDFGRKISIGHYDMRMEQPQARDAVARRLYVELESEDWYGAQTFELDYVTTGECCDVAVHEMLFQPRRDLP